MSSAGSIQRERPVRVAMVLDCLLAGGAERIAVEVACALDRNRFEPFVLVTRYGGPLASHLERAEVPYVILGRRRGFAPSKLLKAQRLLRGADLIHGHKLGSALWSTLFSYTTGVPLVVREPTAHHVQPRLRAAGYRWWIGPAARRIICPSEPAATSLTDLGIDRGKIVIVPNGVQLDAAISRDAARAELGIEGDAFVVGIIARLRPEKAHDVLIRAARRIVEGGDRIVLCIVGDGPERSALESRVQEFGLADTVVWAGERADAKRVPRAFDVGVICSDWEGLPVAALEILAAGTPLISTSVGAMPEIVGDAGTIVPVRDDEALAAAILRYLRDPQAIELAGKAGRAIVEERFGFERMVREFERVYDDVLSSGERTR